MSPAKMKLWLLLDSVSKLESYRTKRRWAVALLEVASQEVALAVCCWPYHCCCLRGLLPLNAVLRTAACSATRSGEVPTSPLLTQGKEVLL